MRKHLIKETLNRINWHYGKGDIVSVDWQNGLVQRIFPYAGYDFRRFRVINNRVRFLGKVRTIGFAVR